MSAATVYLIQVADRAGAPAFAVPANFSQLCTISVDGLDEEQVFYEVFGPGSTPPVSVTLTLASSGWTWAAAAAIAYQNINSNALFDGGCQTVAQTSSTTSLTGAPTTTTVANDMVIWAFFVSGDIGTGAVSTSQGTIEVKLR